MAEKHYDGEAPHEPLPAEHFTEQQKADQRDLGDGSPALDPRGGRNVERESEGDRTEKKTSG